MWLVANDPTFFAYLARNRADGICLIERIDLPTGETVMAMIQTAGNPGQSISNSVESICTQLCDRFELTINRVLWLQHYADDEYDPLEWHEVTFASRPPESPFAGPSWTIVTNERWRALRLRPQKLNVRYGHFTSPLKKLFHWPTDAL